MIEVPAISQTNSALIARVLNFPPLACTTVMVF